MDTLPVPVLRTYVHYRRIVRNAEGRVVWILGEYRDNRRTVNAALRGLFSQRTIMLPNPSLFDEVS